MSGTPPPNDPALQQHPPPPAMHAHTSPMLRLLGRDSGARHSLMHMLLLRELASLVRSGRSWRAWITESSIFAAPEQFNLKHQALESFGQCRWVQRSIQRVYYSDGLKVDAIDDLVLHLPRFSRLRSLDVLKWHREVTPAFNGERLRESFSAVAHSLQHLRFKCFCGSRVEPALLAAVGVLHQLVSFEIEVSYVATGLDFSGLPLLPRLQRLALISADLHRESTSPTPCDLAQVEALSRCLALTDLNCGYWLPYEWPNAMSPELIEKIDHGIGALVRLRKEHGAAPLRKLSLGDTNLVLPESWRFLSQCTALEEIHANWSAALTAEDWMQLSSFENLRWLSIIMPWHWKEYDATYGGYPAVDLGLVLPALLYCCALRGLRIEGYFSLRSEHVEMIALIPALEEFTGERLLVESLAPLTHAPALTRLSFGDCIGLHGEPINIRAMIPPMPLVVRLRIGSHSNSRMKPAEAEPFNAAIRQRMPKLQHIFEYN